ncbi:hypothetical protein OROHE_021350 [Orobanche hederae]
MTKSPSLPPGLAMEPEPVVEAATLLLSQYSIFGVEGLTSIFVFFYLGSLAVHMRTCVATGFAAVIMGHLWTSVHPQVKQQKLAKKDVRHILQVNITHLIKESTSRD